MSSQIFTPTEAVNMAKERDWASSIGMIDWDNTSIVFTKRSLIEFLKHTGVTVDPNFSNISKLPRYAKFGKLTGEVSEAPLTTAQVDIASASTEETFEPPRPSRRVRTAPGGASSNIFGEDEFPDDALSQASIKATTPATLALEEPSQVQRKDTEITQPTVEDSKYRPSRRVRTAPGGHDSVHNLWGDEVEDEVFKPSRRVREVPGGTNHMDGIFG